MATLDTYKELAERMAELAYLGNASTILGWDQRTYMPPGGSAQRAQTLALLDKHIHDIFVNPKNGELIASCLDNQELDPVQLRNVELWKRDYDRATKIPSELVEHLAKQISVTEVLWETAKKNSDFALVQPELNKLVDLIKQKANALDSDKDPYDVMADLYEPKMTGALIEEYFEKLKTGIIPLIKQCQELADPPKPEILNAKCTMDQQLKMSKLAIELVGLDPRRSRLDISEHPFTTGYADDVRITTHYLEADPLASFYSVIHESGHALYELNLPHDYLWTGVGVPVSMGIHESQSRFWENIIGKNPFFLMYLIPKLREIIPGFKIYTHNELIKAINAVIPSKVRIYADEVTYNLHIILRFEIERALLQDQLTIQELPQVWNQKMQDYLGVDIENDREGVLQDVHWYGGHFGYFPDYVLGNIYNSQMWDRIQQSVPDWAEYLQKGDVTPMRDWIITNVHQQGLLYDPVDLMVKITNEPPNPEYFLQYLDQKFKSIMEFN